MKKHISARLTFILLSILVIGAASAEDMSAISTAPKQIANDISSVTPKRDVRQEISQITAAPAQDTRAPAQDNSAQAQANGSGSLHKGQGVISLSWEQSLGPHGVIAYTEAHAKTVIVEDGEALADASALSSVTAGDAGLVSAHVFAESAVVGEKALSESKGVAQSAFLLTNTSQETVRVDFDWSFIWYQAGAIGELETDRAKGKIYLMLRKYNATGMRIESVLEHAFREIPTTKPKETLINNSMAVQYALMAMPPEDLYFDGEFCLEKTEPEHWQECPPTASGTFHVIMPAGYTYLFSVSAEAGGVTTVGLEGCATEHWLDSNAWPIEELSQLVPPIGPNTKFFEAFGIDRTSKTRKTLRQVLAPREGLVESLMRNAVVGLLNTVEPEISYIFEEGDVEGLKALVQEANAALAEQDFGVVESISDTLARYSQLGAYGICD